MNDYIRVCKQCGKVLGQDETSCSECGSSVATFMKREQEKVVSYTSLCGALLRYFETNRFFAALLNISPALIILFPVLCICYSFDEFGDVTLFLNNFSVLIEAMFYVGAVLCFAQKRFGYLSMAFGCTAAYHIITKIEYIGELSFNGYTILAIHIALFITSVALARKNADSEEKLSSEEKVKVNKESSSSPVVTIVLILVALAVIIGVCVCVSSFEVCSQCGTMVSEYYDVYGEIWCKDCFY